jgi:hypothetical protein
MRSVSDCYVFTPRGLLACAARELFAFLTMTCVDILP